MDRWSAQGDRRQQQSVDAQQPGRLMWAGVIPLETTVGTPIRDERCERELPEYLRNYSRKRN